MSEDFARATATAAVPTSRPMPSAYARKSAEPWRTDEARKLATTMARNGAIVQVKEATPYTAPKPTIANRLRLIVGRRGLQPDASRRRRFGRGRESRWR